MRVGPLASVLLAVCLCSSVGLAAGSLESFLGEINVTAHADLPGFRADLSASFGVPLPEIDRLLHALPSPADVYMTLRVGEVCRRPVVRVVEEFELHRGRGWGVIARNLGIKPGSAEFHALKAHRLPSASRHAAPGNHKHSGPGKGHGKKS